MVFCPCGGYGRQADGAACQSLEYDVAQEVLRSIIEQYEIKNGSTDSLRNYPLHFNKGVTGRWMEEFTASQRELSRERFGDILPEMGYEV